MAVSNYGNDSINLLQGAERVRRNPQNLLGSRGLDGVKHTVIEILGNATDEHLSGFGDDIILTVYEDGAVSIRDFGRGVPLGWNTKYGMWNYFLVYEELYAGAKYEDNQVILRSINDNNLWDKFNFKDYPYMISIGMNGVGGACTQYTSEWFEVISYSGIKASRMYYEKGKHVLDELEVTDSTEPSGTLVRWKPDAEVFDDVNIPDRWFEDLCKKVSVTTGFNVQYINKRKGVEKSFKGTTIQEEMKERSGSYASNKFMYHCLDDRGDVCVCEVEAVVGGGSDRAQFFNNMIEIHGGSHSNGLNGAMYSFFYDIGKEKGMRIKDVDYAGKFSFIITTLANKISPRGQTKDSLDDEYIRDAIYNCVYTMLKTEYAKGTKWFSDIIEDVLYASSLRAAQEELLKNHKEIEKNIKRHKVSNKFASCPSYEEGNVEETELFIVEGNSAGGRVKTARDYRYQCILPIRGKSLNVYKATIDKLIANAEIKDLIAALGCGIDLGIDGYESFDINKLKVGKIFILADADIDGRHIAMLLFLIFYKLFPELLYQGKVYMVDTPLYIVRTKTDESIFCMDGEELEAVREEIGQGNILSVDRFKGLGETDADVLWETTLDPAKRHTHQLKINRDDLELVDVLEVLFGKSTERRKQAILGNLVEDFGSVMEYMDSMEDLVKGLGLNKDLEIEDVVV